MVTPNNEEHSEQNEYTAGIHDTGLPVMEPEDIIRNLMRALERMEKRLNLECGLTEELRGKLREAEGLIAEGSEVMSELKERFTARVMAELEWRGGDKGMLLDVDRWMQAVIPTVVRVTMAEEFGL
jgi:predicted RNase H-like nuclease (RuvC/YqgF family)